MTDVGDSQGEVPRKRSKLPLVLGLVLALALGAGGFYATWSGLILAPPAEGADHAAEPEPAALPDLAFVPIEPIVISLGRGSSMSHLRFTAQLEVSKTAAPEVTLLLPRILDVLNGYLRAVEVSRLEDPAALVELRAQMLRRIQIVTGEGRVRDLLVTEFVLN
ncbi:flagellar basal body-associated FliL family protein [Cereibacter sphaeroides]|uniref:flagellar basal body-associated FliL family protein n=1 Tax=Cereibacter sphaeroides TaxID=1063 RepID=UPI001F3D68E6|nr:flagellar basal body-associated FliL family protein [Cereibacter sphaeroides]MCE6960942.1 flagellar basal body-associated FliL family protein [Cereibacter sphaeroides]MCE6969760.1 flagellar basal body-associated FliL family protein [Cereibacter sphaeroides]MCE6975235.1 flagellar basal body-associated FliL family protein [Cereibacter sphaeroides]